MNRVKFFSYPKMHTAQDHDKALVNEINDMDYRFEHNLFIKI